MRHLPPTRPDAITRWGHAGIRVASAVALALNTLACAAQGDTPADSSRGVTYYFADCAGGAAPACQPGDNAHSGLRPSQPKRNLQGLDVNNLPRGSRLLFAKGGVWEDFNLVLRSLTATPTAPLVFDSYVPTWETNAAPWIKAGGAFYAFQFGPHGDTVNDGGYTIRNLKLDGQGKAGSWGVHLRYDVRNVTLENLEITGFDIGLHSQNSGPVGNTDVTLRNSNIHRNGEMGMLGDAINLVIEGNTFAHNNFSGTPFNHAIYLGGQGRNGIIRNNTFTNNSVAPSGICTGGNITVHGQWDGLLIEGNTLTQTKANGGCYGLSITPSYNSAEWFRNTVVRGNTIINLGGCSVCAASAPGIVVEDNRIFNDHPEYHAGILIPERAPAQGDDADGGALIRNNTIYFTRTGASSSGINVRTGAKNRIVSNLIYFGADSNPAHACFVHGPASSQTEFSNNLCHHAGGKGSWSSEHRTLAQANAAGLDNGGQSGDPLFVTRPTPANLARCTLRANSPAATSGHASLSSARAKTNNGKPMVGACDRDAL